LKERVPKRGFFVIIFEKRNGSSFTTSAINSVPNLLCYPEILNQETAERQTLLLEAMVLGEPLEDLRPAASDPKYFHGPLSDRDWSSLDKVGAKICLDDVHDPGALLEFFARHAFQVIYLKRNNIYKAVVSRLNAQRLHKTHKIFNVLKPAQAVNTPLKVDPADFVRRLDTRVASEWLHKSFYEMYEGPKLRLAYEEILADQEAYFRKLFAFLDVPYQETSSRIFKNTSDDLAEAVENVEQLMKVVAERRPALYQLMKKL